jgi:hypothetical protein
VIRIRNNLIITIFIVLFSSLVLINTVSAIAILPDDWVSPNSEISNPESPNTTTNPSENSTPTQEIESVTPEVANNNVANPTENSEIVATSTESQKIISNAENTNETPNSIPSSIQYTSNSTEYPIIETNELSPNNTENSDSGTTSDSSASYATLVLSAILGGTLIMLKK